MYDLRGLRLELGLKQSELADVIGCKQANISGMEKSMRDLENDQLNALIEKFGEASIVKYKISQPQSNINKRIEFIINNKFNGSITEFCKTINVLQPIIKSIIDGKTHPTFEVLNGIIKADGLNINIEWLMTGEGDPFSKPEHLPTNTKGNGVPYFEDIEASCSILSMNMNIPENPTFYIDYEHFNDCNAYIPVVGDSMYPQYCAGEIVAVKQIFNIDIIQWGEAYLIVTNSNANDLRTIKQIHYCEDESKIILRASNPNFKGDTKINKEDIRSLFIIKGKIKRNQL